MKSKLANTKCYDKFWEKKFSRDRMEILWNVPTHDSRCNVRQVNIILDISNERQRFENWFEFKSNNSISSEVYIYNF